jgi:hypothetical protein
MHVFRIHIRPKGTADTQTTFKYCLDNRLLGVGWRTKSQRNTKNWDEYFNEASQDYRNLQICKYIQKWVSEGDLVWTRNSKGQYYLAHVVSGWEYWTSPEAIEQDIDVANIFRCVFPENDIDIDEVPGKVVACFRASRTIQEITDSRAREYSKYLWNKLSNKQIYEIDKSEYSDIFMMLDDEETEDLLFLYLQSQGWYVIPNSRKGDTMSFEYLVVNPQTKEKALTQVKTGEVVLSIDKYSHLPNKVFLFQSNERYTGTSAENVTCVSRRELLEFLDKSIAWLPKSFLTKMEIVNQ